MGERRAKSVSQKAERGRVGTLSVLGSVVAK
jgi:hypothetical protein